MGREEGSFVGTTSEGAPLNRIPGEADTTKEGFWDGIIEIPTKGSVESRVDGEGEGRNDTDGDFVGNTDTVGCEDGV